MTAMRVTHVVRETGDRAVALSETLYRIENGPSGLISPVGLERVLDLHLDLVVTDDTMEISDADIREGDRDAELQRNLEAHRRAGRGRQL